MDSSISQADSAATGTRVVIYVEGGGVHWVGCDDADVQVVVLDDDTDDDRIAGCWREPTIPIAQINAELWAIANPLFRPSPSQPDTSMEVSIPAETIERCTCGSATWDVIEHRVTEFRSDTGTIRPVATTHREIACAICGRTPDTDDVITESYLSVYPEAALIDAAMEVITTWEQGDLASSVQHLGAALDNLGFGLSGDQSADSPYDA